MQSGKHVFTTSDINRTIMSDNDGVIEKIGDRIVIGKGNSENDDNGMLGNNYFLGEFQEN